MIDDIYMVVDKSGMTIDDDFVGFEIQLKVLGEESRLFRFNQASLRLKDDLGNAYDYVYKISYGKGCTESDLYLPKQILLEPDEKYIVAPETGMMYSSYTWWCLEGYDTTLAGYQATLPPNAQALILEFDGFGPFSGFSYRFDL